MLDHRKPIECLEDSKSVCTLLVKDFFVWEKFWLLVLVRRPGTDDRIDYVDQSTGKNVYGVQYCNVAEPVTETRVPLEQGDNWTQYHWVRRFDSKVAEAITGIGPWEIRAGTDWYGFQCLCNNYERSADGVNWEPCWKVEK